MPALRNRSIDARRAAGAVLMPVLLLASAAVARAQEGDMFEKAHLIVKPPPAATPIPFHADRRNYIWLAAPKPGAMRTTIRLGEPLQVPLRLVNHTDFTIAVETNFNQRANLKVFVRPEGRPEFQSFGPYQPGIYTPLPIPLYPFEEQTVNVLLWSERDAPSSLVFPREGKYYLRFELEIGVQLSEIKGALSPILPDLSPLPPIEITVLPPTDRTRPIVEALTELRGFPNLQISNLRFEGTHPDLKASLEKLVVDRPATPLSPYLDLALGDSYAEEAGPKAEDLEKFKMAVERYERAAAADSHIRLDALTKLVRLLDRRGYAYQARDAAEKMLEIAPPERAVRLGSSELYRKYLINSAELSPVKYWTIHP